MNNKPIIGILLGDATGIGPEIATKLAVESYYDEFCRPVFIGDARVFQMGLDTFKGKTNYYVISDMSQADWTKGYPVLDLKDQDPAKIKYGAPDPYCGQGVLHQIDKAMELCKAGKIDGVLISPLNKTAIIEGGCKFASECEYMADILGVKTAYCESNVLDGLMTVRVTSHIPAKDISSHLTIENIFENIELCQITAKSFGIKEPRIAVCAFNPHAGENGLCGREEIDVIKPAIDKAIQKGWNVSGPIPADSVFPRAFRGEYDAVVTMFHDQGQIALKLRAFAQGVTVFAGLGYPICTCAHGTAYGKAGKGIADTTSIKNTLQTVAKMASNWK